MSEREGRTRDVMSVDSKKVCCRWQVWEMAPLEKVPKEIVEPVRRYKVSWSYGSRLVRFLLAGASRVELRSGRDESGGRLAGARVCLICRGGAIRTLMFAR